MRQTAVGRETLSVKVLHTFRMVVLPLLVPALLIGASFFAPGVSLYRIFATILLGLWYYYSYFVLTVLRNLHLQRLALELCDFDAYQSCMEFLEHFNIGRAAICRQKVNSIDAFLIRGDFDEAYRRLMEIRDEKPNFAPATELVYDYYWCRFYAELEDFHNFELCLEYFRNRWLRGRNVSRRSLRNATMLQQELEFREMMFQGKNIQAKEYLSKVYRSGSLESKYEFLRYCYFMGRVEFALANFNVAKHWFAQAVSFRIREHMSKRAAEFLAQIDAMQIPYAEHVPMYNEPHYHEHPLRMWSNLFGIILGLVCIVVMYGM
ncbi:MAG: hypothetical protein K6G23_07870 [Lachnospiraceae bacterium]|nr:hypothetical protein [Lachnospiraceae bacterium]